MLIIDDNTFKLLKMKEKLLKLSGDNRDSNLRDYKEYAIRLDKDAFEQMINNINDVAHANLSLEEELRKLEDIDSDYRQLEELQVSFKRIYDTYSFDSLILSPLSKLGIDKVREKKNAISGYLINLKNIDSNSQRLDELNVQLIEEEKKRKVISDRIASYEEELRSQFLRAEGRKKLGDKLQYTSIIDEYEKIDLRVSELLEDSDLLLETKKRIVSESNEAKKKEEVAETCYNADPSHKYKSILDEIRKETLTFDYQEIMIKILFLIAQETSDIESAVDKREKLIDLFKAREICLSKMSKNDFYIDPFSRIKISDQLTSLEEFNDNFKEISQIRREISTLGPMIEEMQRQNVDYMSSIDTISYFIDDDKKFDDILSKMDVVPDKKERIYPQENRVILVEDAPLTMKMGIVHAKTRNVVNKVKSMVNEENTFSSVVTDGEDAALGESISEESETFSPSLVISKGVNEEEKSIAIEESDVVEDTNLKSEEEFSFDVPTEVELSPIKEKEESIFEDVNPFEDAVIFDTKKNDSEEEISSIPASGNSNTDDAILPDVFWMTDANSAKEDDGVKAEPTFDEQINKLLMSEVLTFDNTKKR